MVVEPSFESLELALKVKQLAVGAGVSNTWAILNKITSDEVLISLKEELARREVEIIGIVHHDPKVFKACLEGHKLGDGAITEDIRKAVDTLFSKE